MNRIGVDNKGLIRRTLTALANKKKILRFGDKYKGFSYRLPPMQDIQRKLDYYLA